MEQIYQSAILQSLGWAIADSIWQMGLLWLIYQLSIGLPFRNKPVARHLGSTIALFTGSIWFVANFWGKLFAQNKADAAHTTPLAKMDPTILQWMESLLPYLSSAYLVVMVVLMARFVHSLFLTQRLRLTDNRVSPPEWQQFVDEVSRKLGMSRSVLIYISDAVNVPATIGFIKPVILLPIASVNQLTVSQVEAIILHELAHIRRYDYLINLTVSFIETILFFNPFTRLFSSQIRKECELCCDDAVLKNQHDPGQYAYALLMLEKNRQQYSLMMAATGKESLLLGRIKRILNQPEQKVKYTHKLAALVLVALLIMAVSLIVPAEKKKAANAIVEIPLGNDETLAPQGGNTLPMMLKMELNEVSVPKMPDPLNAPKITIPSRPVQKDELASIDHRSYPDLIQPPAPPTPPVPPMPETRLPELKKLQDISIPAEPNMVFVNGLNEKELREIFEADQTAKLFLEFGAKQSEVLRKTMKSQQMDVLLQEMEFTKANEFKQHAELRKMNEMQLGVEFRKFEEMQRKQFDMIVEQAEKAKRSAQERIRTRTPRATKPAKEIEEKNPAPDAEMYRSYSMNGRQITAPRVRKFRDEKGMTISVIEEENQIRIHLSDY
jgi:beta-lactamase regulating signal transducer with metallopeptidase domain